MTCLLRDVFGVEEFPSEVGALRALAPFESPTVFEKIKKTHPVTDVFIA